jgi:hypothetical protein
MSWREAQEEAQRWFDKIRLTELVKQGQPVDLRPFADLLHAEGNFRSMVLNAADRKLRKKNISAYLPGE